MSKKERVERTPEEKWVRKFVHILSRAYWI